MEKTIILKQQRARDCRRRQQEGERQSKTENLEKWPDWSDPQKAEYEKASLGRGDSAILESANKPTPEGSANGPRSTGTWTLVARTAILSSEETVCLSNWNNPFGTLGMPKLHLPPPAAETAYEALSKQGKRGALTFQAPGGSR